jgi:hypothetical protein
MLDAAYKVDGTLPSFPMPPVASCQFQYVAVADMHHDAHSSGSEWDSVVKDLGQPEAFGSACDRSLFSKNTAGSVAFVSQRKIWFCWFLTFWQQRADFKSC